MRLVTHKETGACSAVTHFEPPDQGLADLRAGKPCFAVKRLRVRAGLPLEIAAQRAVGGCPAWWVDAVRSLCVLAQRAGGSPL